ncbi:hypothetical protein [Thiohalophilus sp.]|uniref:hypothetical protein n=1 Tax=Thiohalophilus sp. TaxID=3028392 RepID=UPI003975058E
MLEFDRNSRLPGRQRDFLKKMDEDMDRGFLFAGEPVSSPDKLQRARYVAMHLLQAFDENNQSMITATCAYLVQRLPDLNTVEVEHVMGEIHLQLILDR